MVDADAAAPAPDEPPSLLALPRPLLAAILLLAADGDASGLARAAAVCRDLRSLLRCGGPWPQLTALCVASPGGRCPFRLAARGGSLRRLTLLSDSGAGGGEELLALRDAPLSHVTLRGLPELSKAALLAVCAPTLEALDVSGCRVQAEALAAAVDSCPKLRELSADDCALGACATRRSTLAS